MTGFIVGLILCVLSAAAVSRFLPFFCRDLDPDEGIVLSFALGLIFLACAVLLIGITGHLNLQALSLLILIVGFVALRGLGALERSVTRSRLYLKFHPNHLFWACLFLTGAAFFAALSGVFSPELSNDSLCYHLHILKLYLQTQTIQKFPFEVNSLFPFFMEMLYVFGVAFKSIALAKTFHLAAGLLTAGGIIVLGRRLGSVYSAFIAAMLFFTTPGIINQMGMTYVDVGLSCFCFLTFFCYARWFDSRKNSWLVFAGLMAGAALSIKFLALIGILGVLGLILFDLVIKPSKKMGSSLLCFCLPMAAISGYWYLRSWLELGNPVYPYFYQIFKSGDPTIQYNDIGLSKTIVNFAKMPWMMTMRPDIFEGFGDNIGPAYLAFAPLAFAKIKKNPILARAAFFILFYTFCWFLLGQSLRFFFPALPVAALLVAVGIDSAVSFMPVLRRVFSVVVLSVFILHAGLALFHYRETFRHFIGKETDREFLLRRERSFAAAEFVNQNLPIHAKILNACEVHMFYFQRTMIREDVFARDTGYPENYSTPEEVFQALRNEGFTHIFLSDSVLQNPDHMEPLRVPKLLLNRQNSLALSLPALYTYTFNGSGQPPVTYILYQL